MGSRDIGDVNPGRVDREPGWLCAKAARFGGVPGSYSGGVITTNHTTEIETTDRLDTPASFARFANVTSQCVRNWCRDGLIPLTLCCGRIIRFRREDALAALRARPKPRTGRPVTTGITQTANH